MTWDEIKKAQLDRIFPLYNVETSFVRLKEVFNNENGYNFHEEYEKDDYSGIEKIILSQPAYDDNFAIFMFGFSDSGGLDDQSFIDLLSRDIFKPLVDANIFDYRVMESYAGYLIKYDDYTMPEGFPTSAYSAKKEVEDLISTVLGESLSDPRIEEQKISTKVLKSYLENEFNADGNTLIRIHKSKFGKINVRIFCDELASYTILDYNGRIISAVPWDCRDF